MNEDYINYCISINTDKYKNHQPKVIKRYKKVGDKFVNDEIHTTVTCRNSDLILLLKLIEDTFKYGQLEFKYSKALLHIYDAVEEAMK